MPCTAKKIEIIESYWGWCRKWGIPYPCRKKRTVTRYRHTFLPWRTRITWPFRCKYEGCCGGSLYTWSRWCWFGSGNSAWNQFTEYTRDFKSEQSPVGNCPFSENTDLPVNTID